MKKAKIMLIAVAVLGVAGGAFAFSARGTNTFFSVAPNQTDCTSSFLTTLTTSTSGDFIPTIYDSPVTGACPGTTVVTVE